MGSYTRLGSCLLASELVSDPFGAIHRAVVITGSSFDRHVLVRTFSEELFQAGMNARLAEAGRVVPLLGGAKIFGLGYRIESGKRPHVAWDHVPGRSLAQLIDKAKQEQIPFGVDHALTVIQGVAQGIVQMQAKGARHGVLSPHSVWVSFEGTTQLVDAPFASLAKSMLAKAPSAKHRLAPYLQGPDNDALQQDLFALGAVLYELLTFECLPVGGDLQAVLDQATLKAAQEDVPLPAEIRAFLGRLLLGRQSFPTMEAFSAELERVLYEGEYSPTTFNMAFFMHTLFREENDRDATAMKAEQGDNYLAYTAAGEALRSGATRIEHSDDPAPDQEVKPEAVLVKTAAMVIGGVIALVAVLGSVYYFFGRPKPDASMEQKVAELQLKLTKFEQDKADLDAKAKAEGEKTAQLQKQLTETKSADEKAKIQKQIEEAQQRKLDLERQQKAAEQRLAEQRQNEQRLAEQKQASESKPAVPPPAPPPVLEIPKPQPVSEPPKAAVSPAPTAPQPVPTVAPVYESARIVNQSVPSYPQRAIQLRWGTNQDQQVRLKVFVSEQGQALKVSVIEGVAGTYGFDEAAIEAANKSSFSPAIRDGKPVRGWTPEIVYKFLKRN
jgi:TonB family protein